MKRSSLTVLMFLATAACAPEMVNDDLEGEVVNSSEQGLTTTTSIATTSRTLLNTTTVTTTTPVSTATTTSSLLSPPKAPAPANVCEGYNGYTAAIASRTIDCLGTVGPRDFAVDGRGNLQRVFKECPADKSALDDIDALLSLQLRNKELPDVQRCISGRWSEWQKQFLASGIQSCPAWKKVETINAPTPPAIEGYVKQLPKLPVRDTGVKPPVPHENYVVELAYPNGKVDPRCRDEADCAQKCVGGFPGTWIEGSGNKGIIDPVYWLLGIDFINTNPFMSPGYYHPMSYYGALPGSLYGHRHREGEFCSRYVGNMHFLLTLQLDCIDPTVAASCVTRCDEAPIATTGTGSSKSY